MITLRNEFTFEIGGNCYKANNVVLKKMKDCFFQGQAFGQYMFLGYNSEEVENPDITQLTGEYKCGETTITAFNYNSGKGPLYVERMSEIYYEISKEFKEIALGNIKDDPTSIVNYCSLRKIEFEQTNFNLTETKFYCKTFLDVSGDDTAFIASDNNKLVKALLGVEPISPDAVWKVKTGKDYGEISGDISKTLMNDGEIECTVTRNLGESNLVLDFDFDLTGVQRLVIAVDGEDVLVTDKGTTLTTYVKSINTYIESARFVVEDFNRVSLVSTSSNNLFYRFWPSTVVKIDENPFCGEVNKDTKICKSGGRLNMVFLINEGYVSAYYGVKEYKKVDASPINRYAGHILDIKVLLGSEVVLILDNEQLVAGFGFDEANLKFTETGATYLNRSHERFVGFFSGRISTYGRGVFLDSSGNKIIKKLTFEKSLTTNGLLVTEASSSVDNVTEYVENFDGNDFLYKVSTDDDYHYNNSEKEITLHPTIVAHLENNVGVYIGGDNIAIKKKEAPFIVLKRYNIEREFKIPFTSVERIIISDCARYFLVSRTDGIDELYYIDFFSNLYKLSNDLGFNEKVVKIQNVCEKLIIFFESGKVSMINCDTGGFFFGHCAGEGSGSILLNFEKKVYNKKSQNKMQITLSI